MSENILEFNNVLREIWMTCLIILSTSRDELVFFIFCPHNHPFMRKKCFYYQLDMKLVLDCIDIFLELLSEIYHWFSQLKTGKTHVDILRIDIVLISFIHAFTFKTILDKANCPTKSLFWLIWSFFCLPKITVQHA